LGTTGAVAVAVAIAAGSGVAARGLAIGDAAWGAYLTTAGEHAIGTAKIGVPGVIGIRVGDDRGRTVIQCGYQPGTVA